MLCKDSKIYIVVTPFFPASDSFRGSYVYDQVKAIQRTGKYEVIVFRPKSIIDKADQYEYQGIKVYLFPVVDMPSYFFNGLTNGLNACLFVRHIKKLNINLDQVSVVHGHTSSFGIYGLALKKKIPAIKVLVQHHDRDPFTIRNGKLAHWRCNLLYRALVNVNIFNKVDCHVSISSVVEDNLLSFPRPGIYENYSPYLEKLRKIQNIRKIHPKNSVILYNGVDRTKFYPLALHTDTNVFKIGCIGNFVHLKDQITLINAVEDLIQRQVIPGLQVSFIGSGPLLNMCQQYVVDHHLSHCITFEEEVMHHQLLQYYNSLDLFVLPSCYEGFGCVYTEAYACGVPFMACKHQGAAECIQPSDADKWLIEPHDFKRLSYLIEQYYIHRYSQELTVSYDIDILIKQFLEQIDKL